MGCNGLQASIKSNPVQTAQQVSLKCLPPPSVRSNGLHLDDTKMKCRKIGKTSKPQGLGMVFGSATGDIMCPSQTVAEMESTLHPRQAPASAGAGIGITHGQGKGTLNVTPPRKFDSPKRLARTHSREHRHFATAAIWTRHQSLNPRYLNDLSPTLPSSSTDTTAPAREARHPYPHTWPAHMELKLLRWEGGQSVIRTVHSLSRLSTRDSLGRSELTRCKMFRSYVRGTANPA